MILCCFVCGKKTVTIDEKTRKWVCIKHSAIYSVRTGELLSYAGKDFADAQDRHNKAKPLGLDTV